MSNENHLMANALATKYHAGQKYGQLDYTSHLYDVQNSVLQAYPNDERLHVIALLHDILEDTECPVGLLNQLFEDNIVNAVVALTKQPRESAESYETRVIANPMALKVKFHDAKCNLIASMDRGDMKRVKKYSGLINRLAEHMK